MVRVVHSPVDDHPDAVSLQETTTPDDSSMSASATVTAIGTSSKRLEGVHPTPELRQLLQEVLHGEAKSGKAKAVSAPKTLYDVSPILPTEEALKILRDFEEASTDQTCIPMTVLRAVETLSSGQSHYVTRLDTCLKSTSLAFTPPPPSTSSETEEHKRFRRRMERLKLRQEERRYAGLIKNVGAQAPADDMTIRSMTYAASIGLNMIVAPLSFGCFMYFFAGGLLNFVGWERPENLSHTVDIRKVIAGVVSGVGMLFIEMILFVIRSHEMDKATRKKARREKPRTFGHYTSNTERTFKGE
jgi:hypothetical protein